VETLDLEREGYASLEEAKAEWRIEVSVAKVSHTDSTLFATQLEPLAEDTKAAASALKWIRAMKVRKLEGDYMKQLRAASGFASARPQFQGFLASLFGAQTREKAFKAREKARKRLAKKAAKCAWVGKPGDKFGRKLSSKDKAAGATAHPAIEATCVFLTEFETFYGIKTLIKFEDEAGNLFVWFKAGISDVELGKRYSVAATLKEQDEYQGAKQNVIARALLTKLKRRRKKAAA